MTLTSPFGASLSPLPLPPSHSTVQTLLSTATCPRTLLTPATGAPLSARCLGPSGLSRSSTLNASSPPPAKSLQELLDQPLQLPAGDAKPLRRRSLIAAGLSLTSASASAAARADQQMPWSASKATGGALRLVQSTASLTGTFPRAFISSILSPSSSSSSPSASLPPTRSPMAAAASAAAASHSPSPLADSPPTSAGSAPVKRFDSHLHVWASPEEARQFPYLPGQEPTIPGSIDFLLENMAAARVSGALIVQPINHKFDHSYVNSALSSHPDKFIGCCLADPSPDGRGLDLLRQLAAEHNYRAVRFNPYLWPAGEKMTNQIGSDLFQLAGDLNLAVGFMCFKGLLLHIDEIEALCTSSPSTAVLMDHFGFCKPPLASGSQQNDDALALQRLLSLSRFPQVYVKASAFFRVSRSKYPYEDVWPILRQIIDAFGPSRVMWGSDFPFVVEESGYREAWEILPKGFLSEEEETLVYGGTISKLLRL